MLVIWQWLWVIICLFQACIFESFIKRVFLYTFSPLRLMFIGYLPGQNFAINSNRQLISSFLLVWTELDVTNSFLFHKIWSQGRIYYMFYLIWYWVFSANQRGIYCKTRRLENILIGVILISIGCTYTGSNLLGT